MRKEKQHLPEKQPAEKALDRQQRKEIPVANILRLLRKSNNTLHIFFELHASHCIPFPSHRYYFQEGSEYDLLWFRRRRHPPP